MTSFGDPFDDPDIDGDDPDDVGDITLEQLRSEIETDRAALDRRIRIAATQRRPAPVASSVQPEDDLPPLVEPPGYKRRSRGWLYTATGERVPGAQDVTLGRLFRFPVDLDRWIQVPAMTALARDELEWVFRYHPNPAGTRQALIGETIMVPIEDWEPRSRVPLGIYAPELSIDRVLGLQDTASHLGLSTSTLSSYITRGLFAEPVERIGGSPVWSLPIIDQWRDLRPGQGFRTDLKATTRPPSHPLRQP